MLELYYNFFDKYCDATKFEELEMDTDSLYQALSEQNFCDHIRPAMKKEWKSLRTSGLYEWMKFQQVQKQILSYLPRYASEPR